MAVTVGRPLTLCGWLYIAWFQTPPKTTAQVVSSIPHREEGPVGSNHNYVFSTGIHAIRYRPQIEQSKLFQVLEQCMMRIYISQHKNLAHWSFQTFLPMCDMEM